MEIVAQQDGVIYQLQQIASDKQAERGEKISALAKKNDVLNGKAKLLGLITDKQEVRGQVTNLNINDPTADEIAEFNKAARDAGDNGSMILEASVNAVVGPIKLAASIGGSQIHHDA